MPVLLLVVVFGFDLVVDVSEYTLLNEGVKRAWRHKNNRHHHPTNNSALLPFFGHDSIAMTPRASPSRTTTVD
jgi:hypothetical protein